MLEFRRVLRPSGRLGLVVLSRPEGFPYGVVFEALAGRVASERNALLLGFSLGDGSALEDLLKSAGFRDVQVSTREHRFCLIPSRTTGRLWSQAVDELDKSTWGWRLMYAGQC